MRSSSYADGSTGLPSIATMRPRIIGWMGGTGRPSAANSAAMPARWSGWMLITKRLGASGGAIRRQLSRRSARTRVSSSSAVMPRPSAAAWITLLPMRRPSAAMP